MKLYYVVSDNFEGVATEQGYKELRLQMSTGDFHTHNAVEWATLCKETIAVLDLNEHLELEMIEISA